MDLGTRLIFYYFRKMEILSLLRRKSLRAMTLLLLLSPVLPAQNVYTLTPTKEPVRMGNKFLYLRDPSDKMSLDDVIRNGKFVPNNDDVPNYDVTKDAIWGIIKFTATENGDWYLALKPGAFNRIAFYQKKGNGNWETKEEGNEIDEKDGSPFIGHIAVKLDVSAGDTTLMLFRINDFYPLQLDIYSGPLDSFTNPFHDDDIYYGICFGVMLMMFIYNLYLFATQKQSVYIYYVLYVFFNGIFLVVYCGYFHHLIPLLRQIVLFDSVFFPVMFGAFIFLFSMQLFKGLLSKTLVRFMYIFMGVVFVVAAAGALGYNYFAFNAIRMLGLLLSTVCLRAGIEAYKKGSSSAIFYLLGFGSYLTGLTILILAGHLLPAGPFAVKAVITGSMLECIFLSFAQADKLKVAQLEKEKAQQETVAQLQKNEALVREQNVVLEQKVKVRTAELAEKNKEITDSIQYAERIQSTLLAHEGLLKENLSEHFVLFKPKDIVSGDFYWASGREGKFYLAICDSTGHGVPGAFMSLLNISFLNEAINEKDIVAPNEVFNYVRKHLIDSISRDGGRDGMDGILVCFEKKGDVTKVSYAAANNGPILIRNNEMIEWPADKMPVGRGEVADSFKLNEFELRKGDTLYLFTDGYADQFGGAKGKKFKYKQLEEKLMEVVTKPILEQREILDNIFEEWKGNLEQVDDVLVVGIKI